ncbi:MAG: iron-sulfur cluster assembly scaffold protein [Syntrophales bacterium]
MKSTQYSEKTLDHFRNPRNVGTMEGPDVAVGKVGNPVCGDLMYMYIRVKDDRIADIKFQTFGCGSAVATSSMTTELVRGMTLDEAMKVTRGNVADALDGLPLIKMHCSNLAADALHEAIKAWREGRGGETPEAPAPGTVRQSCELPPTVVDGFDALVGKGVYRQEPSLAELKDRRVLVLDRGERSVKLALALTEHTGRVVFMSPYKQPEAKDDFRAPLKRSDVKVLYESQLLAVLGEFEVEKVRVHDLNENEEYELTVDAVVALE